MPDSDRFHQQVLAVHAAVRDRLKGLLDDLPLIDEVDHAAAAIGSQTALIHEALFLRDLFAGTAATVATEGDLMDADEDRRLFVQLAGDCWDDANR
jgi:hypothetical protein